MVVRVEAGVDLAEERLGGLLEPVEVAPPAVAAQLVLEAPPDALIEPNLTHLRWFVRRNNLPCSAHRMTGGSIGVFGRTEAPLPAISDAGAIGDQPAVARFLPDLGLAQSQCFLRLPEPPAAASLRGRRAVQPGAVVRGQADPDGRVGSLLDGVEEAPPLPMPQLCWPLRSSEPPSRRRAIL